MMLSNCVKKALEINCQQLFWIFNSIIPPLKGKEYKIEKVPFYLKLGVFIFCRPLGVSKLP